MPKSELQKQLEKQMKQEKQLADRKRRDDEKRAREEKQQAHKEALRLRASSIVSGQPLIEGFRMMDSTAEEVLRCILKCERKNEHRVSFIDDIFPDYIQMSTSLELEKLVQYGMIGGLFEWDNGAMLDLLPPAFSYFDNKEAALKRKKETEEIMSVGNITNYGNIVFGDVSNSALNVDNSIHEIERMIDERGGEDRQVLTDILEEVKEFIENMEASRSIPKQKKLFQRLTEHFAKHGWFYGAILQLLGTTVMQMIGA